MVTVAGYRILEQLYESAHSRVYRGQREDNHRPIVIKILQSDYPTPAQLAQLNNEYEFTKALKIEGVRRALELTEIEHKPALLLEYVAGETLKRAFVKQPHNLIDFLKVAGQIAQTLGEIHQHNIIHRDINAHNILLEGPQQQVKIIDFGLAAQINLKSYHLGNPDRLEGTLAYISPEQTGRMNRVVDYRTDLYSLGITFYEMLTGQLPFTSNDPLELVHAHLAKTPLPPHHLRPNIPEIISKIVLKLLAKNAEDRYQSAFGLKDDLERCLAQGSELSSLNFELAQHDFSGRFQIPQKLYGREQEIETLLQAFDRVAGSPLISTNGVDGEERSTNGQVSGGTELVLVAGYAGVGKSVLVHEVHKPMTEKRGYFIEGKFDRFQRNIPYYAWGQAFKAWVNLLLTEDEATLVSWRDKILNAVGNIGQIILEVIPSLELIIGSQARAPELGSLEAQHRFHYLFQNFIKAIAQPEHPLVIFIDDWQWADSASLDLFKLLLSDPHLQSLLLIGAYRDNEVSSTHPFMLALEELRREQVRINLIQLHSLSRDHVHGLIADTLSNGHQPINLTDLADLVYEKTLGNAFFVNEFLKSLYAEGLLQFDFATTTWVYELAKIKTLHITDNVVELLAGKILKMPPATQTYLKLAAGIGHKFDVATLSFIAEDTPQGVKLNLARALQEGVIINLPTLPELNDLTHYQFAHDRIQQAAYSLIPDSDKQHVHLKIGRLLLQNIPTDQREERIFEIVNQLNFGVDLLEQPADKTELAELNLVAGKKAKAATAYQPALTYFQTGLALLEPANWQTDYALTLALYTEAAEMAYLTGDFIGMERLTNTIMQQAANILDKVKAYQISIAAKAGQNHAPEAISAARECLEQLLGLTLPHDPTPADIQQGLKETITALAGKQIEDLLNLPLMTDPYSQAAMDILLGIAAVAYRTNPKFVPLIVAKMINLSLSYGNTGASAYAYAGYGFVAGAILQDLASGYRFGQLALQLLERLQAKAYQCNVLTVVNALVAHWQEAARNTLKSLLEAHQAGLETGDLEYAATCLAYYACHAYFVGLELSELTQKLQPYLETLHKLKQTAALSRMALYLQAAFNLINDLADPSRLMGEAYHEDDMAASHLAVKDSTVLGHLYTNKMILSFLFEDYQQATAHATSAAQYLTSVAGQLLLPVFHFYDALIQLANYPTVPESEKPAILARVASHQQKLEKWAGHAPMNHLHKFYLVEAERQRVLGEYKEAREYYDQALQTARAHAYINEEALAAELAGKFYLAKGDTFLAEVYLRRADQGYQRWGAVAKVRQLQAKYPHLVRPAFTQIGLGTVSTTSSTGQSTSQFLDLRTLLKASQTLAGEVDLSQLLAKMIKIVVENAGAEQGFLLLEKDKRWYIEAEYHAQNQAVHVLSSIPIEQVSGTSDNPQIPNELVNYVVTTKEAVVLSHAAAEGQFSHMRYIKKKGAKSVLCLPLLHQGKLAGVLYLENNLTTGAFTPERVELLNLLTSQMAISIENARLYTDLQSSEKKYRTVFQDSRDMIFITSRTGQVIDVNSACFNLLGYTREEFIQMKAQDVYANAAERARFQQEIEAHGSVKDFELKLRRRDGAEIDGLLTATLRHAEDGAILGYQGIVRDITAQKRAEQERLRLSAVERELCLARDIQQSLLPPPKPGWSDLEVVCYSMPAREVGGDLYAYYVASKAEEAETPAKETKTPYYAVAVGDVTGKGIPAALLMAVSLASLGSIVRQGLPPPKLLAQLDTALVDYTRTTKQNCALLYVEITPVISVVSEGKVEEETQSLSQNAIFSLRMANAACPPPLIKRRDGSVEWVEVGGLPLGVNIDEKIGYREVELNLSKGDLMVLISDGVVEARNAARQLFGFGRLERAVKAGPQTSAEAMLAHLQAKLAAFVGETEPHDDMTIVVVRV